MAYSMSFGYFSINSHSLWVRICLMSNNGTFVGATYRRVYAPMWCLEAWCCATHKKYTVHLVVFIVGSCCITERKLRKGKYFQTIQFQQQEPQTSSGAVCVRKQMTPFFRVHWPTETVGNLSPLIFFLSFQKAYRPSDPNIPKDRVNRRFKRLTDTINKNAPNWDLTKLHNALFSLEREITSCNLRGTGIFTRMKRTKILLQGIVF